MWKLLGSRMTTGSPSLPLVLVARQRRLPFSGFQVKQCRVVSTASSSGSSQAKLKVGNTYNTIPLEQAELDRTGRYHKRHDWSIYVDVVEGDPDLLEGVLFNLGPSFKPQQFLCSSPVFVSRPDGSGAWRFSTRQQTYGSSGTKATIQLRGSGGSRQEMQYQVALSKDEGRPGSVKTFKEPGGKQALKMLKLPSDQRFGIELELTSSDSVEAVAATIETAATGSIEVLDYSGGRPTLDRWKLVPDSSIQCSPSTPGCSTFELVSPILQGGKGLQEVSSILQALKDVQRDVNRSTGFHVHMDVSSLSIDEMIKVCQNFIKYEFIMDHLQPPSRRSGNEFARSNRGSVNEIADATTNRQRHDALASCNTIQDLVSLMNGAGTKHYKLNLLNLQSGRQNTIEFRQHSSTTNYKKVGAWVRFCAAFVKNSARLREPTPFKENRSLNFQFDALFQYVIKDRALRDFYRTRLEELNDEFSGSDCGCNDGDPCENC